jgi:hypothetical protein
MHRLCLRQVRDEIRARENPGERSLISAVGRDHNCLSAAVAGLRERQSFVGPAMAAKLFPSTVSPRSGPPPTGTAKTWLRCVFLRSNTT